MREAGMAVRIDAVGNVIGRYEGARDGLPALLLGSHLDTVVDAGKYDGMLGVVAAIECVDVLHRRIIARPFALEVVAFSDEEGARFASTLLGSRALAGTFDLNVLDNRDVQGLTMRKAMQRYGLDPDAIASAMRTRGDILGYVELHIEQGPLLEADDLPVGVVTAINGANRFFVDVSGVAGHAGTVPMGMRHDALAGAAECIVAIENLCSTQAHLVGTVGAIEASPGALSVIAGSVRFSVDIRAPIDELRLDAVARVREALAQICERRGLTLAIEEVHENRAVRCSPRLIQRLSQAIAAEGFTVRELPSAAGHDAMALADLTEVGMLFVRCKGGVSHSPAESVSEHDVAIALRILLDFIEHYGSSSREEPS
jgi:allantoate deiminase